MPKRVQYYLKEDVLLRGGPYPPDALEIYNGATDSWERYTYRGSDVADKLKSLSPAEAKDHVRRYWGKEPTL